MASRFWVSSLSRKESSNGHASWCRVTRFWSSPKEYLAPAAGVTRHYRLGVLVSLLAALVDNPTLMKCQHPLSAR